MKYPKIEHDGEKYSAEFNGRKLSGDSHDSVMRALISIEDHRQEPARTGEFLEAWKQGVRLAGLHLFDVTTNVVESANDRNQLRPNLGAITASISSMSHSDRVFILLLYQFYCESDASLLCVDSDITFPSLRDISELREEKRSVILRLIESNYYW